MKFSFYESTGDSFPISGDIVHDAGEDSNEHDPWQNDNVEQFYEPSETKSSEAEVVYDSHIKRDSPPLDSGGRSLDLYGDFMKNTQNTKDDAEGHGGPTNKTAHAISSPSELPGFNSRVQATQTKTNEHKNVPQFYEPSDVTHAMQTETNERKNVHQFYEPSDVTESTLFSGLGDLIDNLHAAKDSTTGQGSDNSVEGEEHSEVNHIRQEHKEAKIAPLLCESYDASESCAYLLDSLVKVMSNEQEFQRENSTNEFHHPSESRDDTSLDAAPNGICSFQNIPAAKVDNSEEEDPPTMEAPAKESKNLIDATTTSEPPVEISVYESKNFSGSEDANKNTDEQKKQTTKNLHQFYQPSGESTISFSAFGVYESKYGEVSGDVNKNMEEQGKQPTKKLDQVHQPSEESPVSLCVSSNKSEYGPEYEGRNTVEQENEPTTNSHQPYQPSEAGAGLLGDARAGEIKYMEGSEDAIKNTDEHETQHAKSSHQFYQPSNRGAITLGVKNFDTRSARAAHLTNLNLTTMENLLRLQTYHESKRSEVTLLDKYGFRS